MQQNTVFAFGIIIQLTTSDKMSERTRSPHSLLVSCPNWYNAPRNLRILLNSLDVSDNKIGVAACGVDAADDVCGGVVDPPFWIGDVLPLAVRCNAKVVYWAFGEIGDRGATARTLSGESGVRPKLNRERESEKKTHENQHARKMHNFFLLLFKYFDCLECS